MSGNLEKRWEEYETTTVKGKQHTAIYDSTIYGLPHLDGFTQGNTYTLLKEVHYSLVLPEGADFWAYSNQLYKYASKNFYYIVEDDNGQVKQILQNYLHQVPIFQECDEEAKWINWLKEIGTSEEYIKEMIDMKCWSVPVLREDYPKSLHDILKFFSHCKDKSNSKTCQEVKNVISEFLKVEDNEMLDISKNSETLRLSGMLNCDENLDNLEKSLYDLIDHHHKTTEKISQLLIQLKYLKKTKTS